MTNAEKYLKEGINIQELIQELLQAQFFDIATDIDKARLERT